ncbi:MAG TPA: lipid-A-disaccharide synthase [Candidatus Saccharimonadales bacterium]|nr:lipid-A-disaccharide synthase [Candidatus Saccharimonadales bacterium]
MSNGTNLASRPLRVMISAGEASGEMYGAELLTALRELRGGAIDCFGMGGERMSEAGCRLVVHARDVAVVGLFEVLSHLPGIYRQFHRLLAEVDRQRPDVAVLIDFPDWNFRLAKELHRRGIPVVYYVSPQLWAWRKGRLKLVQRYVSEMLVIFPFEREFYAQHGVGVEFVGHPLSELESPRVSREDFAARWGLDVSRKWIALLPGSRSKELRLNLPAMLGAAERLGAEFEFVMPVASTLDKSWVREQILLCTRNVNVKLTDNARASLLHSRVGVVASGTATVEAALIGTPFVMVYRVAGLTWTLGRHLVKLPHYGMVNLVAGREVVPELIQDAFTPESVEQKVRDLLDDGEARERMTEALAEVCGKLCGDLKRSTDSAGARPLTSADRAAQAVLRVAELAILK